MSERCPALYFYRRRPKCRDLGVRPCRDCPQGRTFWQIVQDGDAANYPGDADIQAVAAGVNAYWDGYSVAANPYPRGRLAALWAYAYWKSIFKQILHDYQKLHGQYTGNLEQYIENDNNIQELAKKFHDSPLIFAYNQTGYIFNEDPK